MTGAGAAIALAAMLAQATPAEPVDRPFTAEDDMACAIYVTSLIADIGADMTVNDQIGLVSVMTYFLGRYEAQRGPDLVEGYARYFAGFADRDPVKTARICTARMRDFGRRLRQVRGASVPFDTPPPDQTEAPLETIPK